MKLIKNIALVMAFVSASFGTCRAQIALGDFVRELKVLFDVAKLAKEESGSLREGIASFLFDTRTERQFDAIKSFVEKPSNKAAIEHFIKVWLKPAGSHAYYQKLASTFNRCQGGLTIADGEILVKRWFTLAMLMFLAKEVTHDVNDMAKYYDKKNPEKYSRLNLFKVVYAHSNMFVQTMTSWNWDFIARLAALGVVFGV